MTEKGRGPSGVRVVASWRLNERHYGSLQGLNKKETAALMGEDKVHGKATAEGGVLICPLSSLLC